MREGERTKHLAQKELIANPRHSLLFFFFPQRPRQRLAERRTARIQIPSGLEQHISRPQESEVRGRRRISSKE